MAILETNKPVSLTQREVAVVLAQAVSKSGLVEVGERFRNDVNGIQIDPILFEAKVTDRHPGVRLQFAIRGGYGVTLNVSLREFEAAPVECVQGLFKQLNGIIQDAHRRRHTRRESNAALYHALTQGVAANG
ncbi:hypothetical protein [Marinobacter sp. MDS2]|uniref:hypothetical protein n=1 Tax=Marinobacter sp. MDS2 TaxID=3065961 RepID=UPI00273B6D5C|nr:hypothetical protein [Marinobacter sp. MDS2]MDP4546492.1 hypothetical protein [Marinobacter sp. MDS2]